MDIRVVKIDGKPWFVGRDIAVLLGYSDAPGAVRKHCKKALSLKEFTKVAKTTTLHPVTKMIPKSDLYRLVMRSDMEVSKRYPFSQHRNSIKEISKENKTFTLHIQLGLHPALKNSPDSILNQLYISMIKMSR